MKVEIVVSILVVLFAGLYGSLMDSKQGKDNTHQGLDWVFGGTGMTVFAFLAVVIKFAWTNWI
jgi:hypothetical protein